MTDTNKIVEKIQHLLDKTVANGASEAEAKSALLMAQKLMAKYNLEQADLTGDETIKYSLETTMIRVNPRSKRLCLIIANSFACKVILQKQGNTQRIVFFGREDNAKAAKSALEYIHRVLEKGMNKACQAEGYASTAVAGASLVYNAYADGFIIGLKGAMDAQTTALAIVVPQDVKDEFSRKFPKLGHARGGQMKMGAYASARAQGIIDGKNAMNKRALPST